MWAHSNRRELDATMARVQIMLDKKLLRAADQAARRLKRSRSALVRDALREHLRRLHIRELEQRDHEGYCKRTPKAVFRCLVS